jgi:hypothetical protein
MICVAGLYSTGATSAHLTKEALVKDWVKKTGVFFIAADASEGPKWLAGVDPDQRKTLPDRDPGHHRRRFQHRR